MTDAALCHDPRAAVEARFRHSGGRRGSARHRPVAFYLDAPQQKATGVRQQNKTAVVFQSLPPTLRRQQHSPPHAKYCQKSFLKRSCRAIGIGSRRESSPTSLPHHRTCGSASGGSVS